MTCDRVDGFGLVCYNGGSGGVSWRPATAAAASAMLGEQDNNDNSDSAGENKDLQQVLGHKLTTGNCPADNMNMAWNEWHGLHNYNGIPVDGGIECLDRLYGTQWRPLARTKEEISTERPWGPADQKHYSRVSQCIRGIQYAIEHEGRELQEILRELTHKFVQRKGGGLSGVVKQLQDNGYLQKKERQTKLARQN